ncbi:hypothetical protein DOTSEDRAFT_80398 [Dothistroma septosporum NZE10]|uniref:Uncharacterized protein n=1 Tax=Dothistroma septosporum (strain NZE10 / CBS 128990) TaxID=675120 RepID=N1PN29_DOTSN|nr:hypothetical protein DOTSEDRAFT_80398 [Dothistroma septosporum NZE10]
MGRDVWHRERVSHWLQTPWPFCGDDSRPKKESRSSTHYRNIATRSTQTTSIGDLTTVGETRKILQDADYSFRKGANRKGSDAPLHRLQRRSISCPTTDL